MDAKRYSLFWFNEKICINGILFYLDERKRKERKEKGRNEVLVGAHCGAKNGDSSRDEL